MTESQRIGIMQPYFFPYLGYFQLINETNKFVIYEHVSFRKKSWITRNRILNCGTGQPVQIGIPLKKSSSNRLIRDLQIDNSQLWKKKLLNLVYFNYKKSVFFQEVYEHLQTWMKPETDLLHNYNAMIIKQICDFIGINTEIIAENPYALSIEQHLSEKVMKGDLSTKTQRIIQLCNYHGIDSYLNPIGGTTLYEKNNFTESGLQLNFINTTPFTYKQFKHSFVPHLSILDVLFHNGKKGTQSLLNHFEIV